MMDEIFGEENFLACIAWQRTFIRSNNAKLFSNQKEFIIAYRKSDTVKHIRVSRTSKLNATYTNPDNDPRGSWITSSYVNPATAEKRPNLVYAIHNPVTEKDVTHPTHAWKYSIEMHQQHVKENRLWWGKSGEMRYPRLKNFLVESNKKGLVPIDLILGKEGGTTDEGTKELQEIFGNKVDFNNPKPHRLIKKLIQITEGISGKKKNLIILDSFAGSGTTAYSVLALNKEDEGNRKFILVECEDYADTLTAERVRRMIRGIPTSKNFKEPLGGSFTYYTLGEPLDVNQMLIGELPDYSTLAAHLIYTATGVSFNKKLRQKNKDGLFYSTGSRNYYLLYKPDLKYMRSDKAMLDEKRAKRISDTGKKAVVFGAGKHMRQRDLAQNGHRVLRHTGQHKAVRCIVELTKYQEAALDRFGMWIKALADARKESESQIERYKDANLEIPDSVRNYPKNAWKTISGGDMPYVDRYDNADRPIPHACFKIPTGGGKTLLSSAILERLNMHAGLVIWVAPTDRIYWQTWDALRQRDSPIRQRLDHGSGGRVKIMNKDGALTNLDVEHYLCVMLVSLGSINRDKRKDFLLLNRDSGAYGSFFPDEDDARGISDILKDCQDLDTHESGAIVHSLANVFRLLHPTVILDEAHKAYKLHSQKNVEMINRLSPSLVAEMSATPYNDISNILVDVKGMDLWNEEMIKMPIEMYINPKPNWEHVLDVTRTNLQRLEADAESLQSKTGRYIRPIALVRVERTGKDQNDGVHVHAENVRKYLTEKHSIPPHHIAVQATGQKELDGIDLMNETTQIRWIITKDAIKEGWDCPFAYALAILDNIKTHTSVTQLIGRVLRQPGARRTGMGSLDKCYVYCNKPNTGEMAEYVGKCLQELGMGDMADTIRSKEPVERSQMVEKKQRMKGDVFLPLVLHKDGKSWTDLEYERHVLADVDFSAIDAPEPPDFNTNYQKWTKLKILPDGSSTQASNPDMRYDGTVNVSDFARALTDMVPNAWQAARIAQDFMGKLHDAGKTQTDIDDGLPYVAGVLHDCVAEDVNQKAESVFRGKVERGRIRFDLKIEDKRYKIKTYSVKGGNIFTVNGKPARRTLFDYVYEDEINELERKFAIHLDTHEAVTWWHRLAVRQSNGYSLRGWKKGNIYPDFIVMANKEGDEVCLGIYDTKGEHLVGNPDTEYKKDVLKTLEDAFNCGMVTVSGNRMSGEFRLVLDNKFPEILA